jgi:rhodanese-related sulfurtransferase
MERKLVTIEELKSWLHEGKDIVFLDVMNPEYFAEKHIVEAKNAPVYEVAFSDHVEKLGIGKDDLVIIYNQKENSLSTQDAAMKLTKLGFKNVFEFPGGLSKWEEAGFRVERGEQVAAPVMVDGEHQIDLENSLVGWSGRNAKYAHRGTINLKSGKIVTQDGKLINGEFVLDMSTIKDLDLTDDMWRGILESHLKSSDFFDVENFPEASFVFDQAEEIPNALIGTPNYRLKGELTIKGVTNPIEFPAMIVPMADGTINGQAHFDFDRTLWNVRYGSEKFFENLGMHLVNDIVTMELFLVAKK